MEIEISSIQTNEESLFGIPVAPLLALKMKNYFRKSKTHEGARCLGLTAMLLRYIWKGRNGAVFIIRFSSLI